MYGEVPLDFQIPNQDLPAQGCCKHRIGTRGAVTADKIGRVKEEEKRRLLID